MAIATSFTESCNQRFASALFDMRGEVHIQGKSGASRELRTLVEEVSKLINEILRM
jgi:hypothetical protein